LTPQQTRVADIGEFGLIDRIRKLLPETSRKELMIGMGDDTAAIQIDENRALLLTCDIQVEGQHFQTEHLSFYQLGKRAMAVNLSDIAAMGGTPTFALVSMGLPDSLALTDFEQLIRGLADQLSQFSASIIGGNLTRIEKKLIIDITLVGEARLSQLVTRSGAKPGDRIFVSGKLGVAAAGLSLMEKYGKNYPGDFKDFVDKHVQPIPRIETGRRIAQSGFATAMIDLSDGLASDLFHICTMSRVGATIYQHRLPLPPGIDKIARLTGTPAIKLALYAGEDYELLFTVKAGTPQSWISSLAQESGIAITEIGQIVPDEAGYVLIDPQGNSLPLQPTGWDHFKK